MAHNAARSVTDKQGNHKWELKPHNIQRATAATSSTMFSYCMQNVHLPVTARHIWSSYRQMAQYCLNWFNFKNCRFWRFKAKYQNVKWKIRFGYCRWRADWSMSRFKQLLPVKSGDTHCLGKFIHSNRYNLRRWLLATRMTLLRDYFYFPHALGLML